MQILKNHEEDSLLLSQTAQQASLCAAGRRAEKKRPQFEKPLMERKRIPAEERQMVRMDKVASLHRALANHSYVVSAQDLASKLIDYMRELGD